MTLIMVEKEITFVWRFEIGKSAGSAARTFRVLVRIGSVKLGPPPDTRRIRRALPASDTRTINGKREEDIGTSEDIMIKEILCAGAKIGNVKRPTRQGNG